jgi:hypothetical protein
MWSNGLLQCMPGPLGERDVDRAGGIRREAAGVRTVVGLQRTTLAFPGKIAQWTMP